MKFLLLMLPAVLLCGCPSVSQEELNAKVQKCTDAGMEFTYMKDIVGKPYDVVCVRKHANEK